MPGVPPTVSSPQGTDFVDISDVRLEVARISPTSAKPALPPLLFLHEGLGSVSMWRDWPSQLCAATGREGWVYSRRGYGQSDPVPDVRGAGRLRADYLHEEAWTVLPALLRALKVEKPVLVGHSDGGSIALLHASRFEVAACVVMAPHVMVEDISIRSIEAARDAFVRGDLRARLAKYHADVDCAFWQWNDVWLSEEFRSFDIRPNCGEITAPVLAIQGFDDPYGSMRQIDDIEGVIKKTGHWVSNNKRNQLQKLEHCGHSPHRDQPDTTTHLIAAFLSELASGHSDAPA